MNTTSNGSQLLHKNSYLERKLHRDIIEDGVAHIPCKVEGMDDVINKFSIPGKETANAEFMLFVMEYIDYIPEEYPVVLDIYGPTFTPEERKVAVKTITEEMDYLLGKTDYELRYRRRIFLIMVAGTILSGCLLGVAKSYFIDAPLEFFYVIFWLFADSLVRYLFIQRLDYHKDRIRAQRLANMKVAFKELDA